jgi:ABC-type multidrug transport system fused ATPase/permease subunit
MNSVERVVYYATEIEQEAPHVLLDKAAPSPWPAEGRIEFEDVVLKYGPGLPSVLKGLTMSIQSGEKIGIVGRCVFCRHTNECFIENY